MRTFGSIDEPLLTRAQREAVTVADVVKSHNRDPSSEMQERHLMQPLQVDQALLDFTVDHRHLRVDRADLHAAPERTG